MHVVRREVGSKSSCFALEPSLVVFRHSWFTSNCSVILCTLKTKQKNHFLAFLFLAHTIPYRKKIKRNAPLEIRTYLLYARSRAPSPLHHSGRYCRTATYIKQSISNNLISSVYSAKTTDNRLEIKLAYATPFELHGQNNTTINIAC